MLGRDRTRWVRTPAGGDYENRTVGMFGAVGAHRTHKQSADRAVPSSAHDEQLCVTSGSDQSRSGGSRYRDLGHPRWHRIVEFRQHSCTGILSRHRLRVEADDGILIDHLVPGRDDSEVRREEAGLFRCVVKGDARVRRAINTDDDKCA